MSASDDLAKAFDQFTGDPAFDPLRMMTELMTGQARLHSVFLAPFPPTFAAARTRYLQDGTGPLTAVAEDLKAQGAPQPDQAARNLLTAAQGMCVVVIALDHGISAIPQLFFGRLDPEVRTQMAAVGGEGFPDRAGIEQALERLAQRLNADRWPALVAGPARGDDLGGYWLALAASLVESLDAGFAGLTGDTRERVADLAWWTANGIGIARTGQAIDPADVELLVRVQLLGGEPAAAGEGIDALIRADGVDEEGLIDLLTAFVDGAIRAGQTVPAAAWLAQRLPAWSQALGGLYDLPLALIRLQAAAGVGTAELLPSARLLSAANRKAARNDLTKEPIWQVVADPGELLDTARAAERIGRSTSFIAKRLDARTIPCNRQGDQVRLPARALDAWKAVMDEFKLLE